jgi:hypothetical protein
MLLGGATSGFAAITFTLTSAGPTNLGGVYTSPYTATISGVTNVPVPVICDDFNDDVWVGESWNVTQTSLASLPLTGSSSPVLWDTGSPTQQVTDYITAALLTEQLLTMSPSTSQAQLLSYAIWDVFEPTASSTLGAATNNTVVNSYLLPAQNQAKALVTSSATLADATAKFANVMIYTADTKSGGSVVSCPAGKTCGAPQEFLVVSMAEPASPVLLIVDLLAVISLVCLFRGRQRKATVN